MPADSIQLIIDYKNGNIKTVSKEAEDEIGKAGKKGGDRFSDGFSGALGGVLSTLGKIAASAAAIGGVALFKSVKDAATLENINTQFEVMLKSSSAAQKQIQELQDFAASTPFQLEGLSQATTQLLSFGVAQQNIIPTLQQLGDIAAGVGADITDLTIPFGRLISTQKLTLVELDKFADRGVNIYAQLAEQTGRSLRTIREDISRGVVPFEEFTKALNNLTGESGLFFQGMEKQSKTLSGTLSTLGDNFFNLSANIGSAFSPIVVELANRFITVLQDLNKEVTENFNVFEDILDPMIAFNQGFITYVIVPFEQLKNVGDVVFDSLAFGFNSLIEGAAKSALAINKLLNRFGLESDKAVAASAARLEVLSQTSEELAGKLSESIASIGDFSISDGLSEKNEELREFFQEQRAIIEQEAAVTNEVTQAQIETVAEQSQTFAQLLFETFNNVAIGINNTKEQMQKVAQQTAGIVRNGLAKGIAGGIQNIVTSLANGENVFKNFGKFILSTFGDLAIQLGTFFIAQGIAIEALNAVSGTGAIAAGAALVALGSILKSFSGSGGASASSAASAPAPATDFGPPDQPTGEFLDEDERENLTPTTNVVFNIDGNVKGDEEFIRDTVASIGEEAGKQGLVFENFRTA